MVKKLFILSMLGLGMLLVAGAAWADSVPITNASFENYNPLNYSCTPGCYNYSSTSNALVPGWSVNNGGSWQPTRWYFPTLPNGSTVAYTINNSISQLLTGETVQPNSIYDLGVYVGNRGDGANGLYTISLDTILNGVMTTLCTTGVLNANNIAAHTFQQEGCQYQSGSTVPAGNLYLLFTAVSGQLDVDNVTLTDPQVNVPEPSSLLLLGVGGMLVLGAAFLNKKKSLPIAA
jgi:hypothetical protein